MCNNDFHYRLIKARVAETLIKELFLSCGYNVFDYGMERTLPTILGKIKNLEDFNQFDLKKSYIEKYKKYAFGFFDGIE